MTHSFTIAGLFARDYVIFLKVFQFALRLQINFVNLMLNDFNPYLTYFVYKGPSTNSLSSESILWYQISCEIAQKGYAII